MIGRGEESFRFIRSDLDTCIKSKWKDTANTKHIILFHNAIYTNARQIFYLVHILTFYCPTLSKEMFLTAPGSRAHTEF